MLQIQTFKTAIEVLRLTVLLCPLSRFADNSLFQAARVLLRVDDVVQATRKERQQEQGAPAGEPVQD
jgi:hypothetical protein